MRTEEETGMMENNYKNWRLETDGKQILWLWFDKANASTNTISPEVLNELSEIINGIENSSDLKGVVIGSAKTTGFIAGADIEVFTQLKDIPEAEQFIQLGLDVFNRLANVKIPTVAMIDGFCVGGGLELALACRYRVATSDGKTRLGLPEVLLGIRPGWGGSERLPALIGAVEGIKMILKGSTVNAKVAAKLGLIDAAVPKRQLTKAAEYYVLQKPAPHKPSFIQAVSNSAVARPLLAKMFLKNLRSQAKKEHYPALYAVVEHWRQYGIDFAASMQAQPQSIAKAVLDRSAQNLVRIFFLQERLKNAGKDLPFKAQHVHVVGSGTMGGDIAAWCALSGMQVTLQDREAKLLGPAIQRAQKLFKDKLKEKRLVQAAMDRLIPDVAGSGIARADVIIEAIYENLDAKKELFKLLETKAKANAILATNTSSIPLDEINNVLQQPERLVGIHFFNPVAKMRLVEIVQGNKTSETVAKQAMAFVRSLDKLPLLVKSSPGFLVNRALMPYLMEAVALVNEGVSPATVDKAAFDFGMPMGPVELADTVGLDVCLSVANNLTKHFGGEVPQQLKDLVAAGHLGRKTGKGFYTYKNGKAVKPAVNDVSRQDEITDRLILRMLNECMACLREGVVADGDLLDAGMVFGTGFAPFRGGPIQYIRQTGADDLKEKLADLEQKFGPRFKADPQWDQAV